MGGVCGVYLPGKECYDFLLQSTFHLQHRGTQSSAIDTSEADPESRKIRAGEIKKVFDGKEKDSFKGDHGIAGLSGDKAELIRLSFSDGDFSLIFDGEITNSKELREGLKSQGEAFSTNYESEILGRLISKGDNVVEGLKLMGDEIEGSCSLVLLTDEKLYAFRSARISPPLVVGGNEDGYALASESPALTEMGFEDFRDVEPGEILKIDEGGVEQVGRLSSKNHKYCAFEWMYTARPDSIIEGVESEKVRKRAGELLSENDGIEADIVAPVPQSGIGYSIGYHHKSGIPYDDVFYLNRYSSRSYIPTDPKLREQIASEKLSIVHESIRGNKIIICEDSIVRGNQMLRIRNSLKKKGKAKEVHARVGSPPINAPCSYTDTTKQEEELIYNRFDGDVDKISKKLNLDSLRYNTVNDMVEAIGLPKEKLCLGCFAHDYTG